MSAIGNPEMRNGGHGHLFARTITCLPDPASKGQFENLQGLLAKADPAPGDSGGAGYCLVGPGDGERVALPDEPYWALRQVVEALSQGLAVTVAPRAQLLTAQQAADLLGVSRPTLVRLLEQKKIPFELVGNHRRVRLDDILRYREQRREEQVQVLAALAVPVEGEGDLEEALAITREVRRKLAAARRSR
jgi:excisionase family DNA binding protein